MTWKTEKNTHKNPTNNARVSSAAYNFVELPDKVVQAVEKSEDLPDHDTYTNPNHPNTGYFVVTLTTKTPLYVRCPLTPKENQQREEQTEKAKRGEALKFREKLANKPNFFYTKETDKEASATIPGSSLRGMLRNLLEIVSYSKVEVVTRKRLFFRSLDNFSLGDEYRTKRMKKIETGFWHQDGDTYSIEKCCVAKVFQYPFFDRNCIKDPVGLLKKINSEADAVSKLIKERLSEKALKKEKQKFEEFSQQEDFTEDDLKKLNSTLRQILDYMLFDRVKRGEEDKKLSDQNRFDEFGLSDNLKELVALKLEGEKAIQRNRILLEAVYKDEIEKSKDNRTVTSLLGKGNFIELYEGKDANATPKWDYQYHKVYLPAERAEQIKEFYDKDTANFYVPSIESFSLEPNAEYSIEGTLVLTGPMNSKKRAFIFFKAEDAEKISVPNDLSEEDINKRLIDRFNDDDQLTQWQQKAFSKNVPEKDCRKRNGLLRNGEPVFFLREGDNDELSFFGRARMFRLPYLKTPVDFVPEEIRKPEQVDFAEAIFGFTKKDGSGKAKAYSSRVFVSDAKLEPSNQTNLFPRKVEPSILASPKPTAFQHYLVQTTDIKENLYHYGADTPTRTVIRGHKLYWHRGKIDIKDLQTTEKIDNESKQHTQFKPIRSEVTFQFKLYFENLSNEEIGVLCWVLKPNGESGKTYLHKLGMGKAFGMGAIQLDASLFLENRITRYTELFEGNNWQKGERLASDSKWQNFVMAFEDKIRGAIGTVESRLSNLGRIKMLLKMLEWEETPTAQSMLVRKTPTLEEFKERKVLPSPLDNFDEREVNRSPVSHIGTTRKLVPKKPLKDESF
jgi:CRISPR-associated protein (TIGR03986 family)